MKLPFLSKINSINSSSTCSGDSKTTSQWPWPAYCHQPKTLSFRTSNFKTCYNFDTEVDTRDESCYFTNSSNSASFSTESDGDSVETVIRGIRSEKERLFFEPGETSSILKETETTKEYRKKGIKESVVMSMESNDPFVDFKKSMEEMVEAYGLKNSWEGLEELLSWYLKLNGKNNHGYVIGAFVDLLVSFAFESSSSSNCQRIGIQDSNNQLSPSSPLSVYMTSSCDESCSSTNCVSLFEIEEEEIGISDNPPCSSSSKGDNDHGNVILREIQR